MRNTLHQAILTLAARVKQFSPSNLEPAFDRYAARQACWELVKAGQLDVVDEGDKEREAVFSL